MEETTDQKGVDARLYICDVNPLTVDIPVVAVRAVN